MRPLFPLLPGIAPAGPDFILHAAAAVPWLVTSLSGAYVQHLVVRMSRLVAGVPEGWLGYLGTLLRAQERRGRKTALQVDAFLGKLASFTILIDDDDPVRTIIPILAVARAHALPLSEAAHLELAARLNIPLATTDPVLTRAAAAAGVPIFTP